MSFQFQELKLKQEGSWFKRFITSPQTIKTLIAVVIGAIAGFLYWYLTEGKTMDELSVRLVVKSMLLGGFFGLFVTNSPCARGRC